jgi:hypothetical protein
MHTFSGKSLFKRIFGIPAPESPSADAQAIAAPFP